MHEATADDRCDMTWFFGPCHPDDFLLRYSRRLPLHIMRNQPGYYSAYFSLDVLERVLYGCKLTTSDVRLVKEGVEARVEDYVIATHSAYQERPQASSVVDPGRATSLFARGCTLNLNSAHRFCPSLASLARQIETFFRCHVVTNAYLTPGGNKGFAVHYDCHDTLIAQVEGSKRWRVYQSSLEEPLDHQLYNRTKFKPGPLLFERDLQPGDLLYLPRGFCHEGKANAELSLHVTFGLFPPRWVQVVTETLMRAAEKDVRLRRNAGDDDADIPAVLAEVLTSERLNQTLAALRHDFAVRRDNGLDGQLRQLAQLESVCEESVVGKRDGALYDVEATADGICLCFSGRRLQLPSSAGPIIRALEAQAQTRVRDLLPIAPDAVRVVRRLIQEGFAIQTGLCPAAADESFA